MLEGCDVRTITMLVVIATVFYHLFEIFSYALQVDDCPTVDSPSPTV
jgi:hypothetical protein